MSVPFPATLTCFPYLSPSVFLIFFSISTTPFCHQHHHIFAHSSIFPVIQIAVFFLLVWFHYFFCSIFGFLCVFPFCSLLLPPSLPQVAALQEEKSSLLAENQVLMERLNQSDSIEDINSPAGRRHLQLQTQLEQLQEETFRCGVTRSR